MSPWETHAQGERVELFTIRIPCVHMLLPHSRGGRRTRFGRTGCWARTRKAEGWNVLALSNRTWKLPDDLFRAFLEHYVSDLPRFNLGLVVKKSEYFPYIMDVDKSATKGASVGTPVDVLKVVVRALKSVVSFPNG